MFHVVIHFCLPLVPHFLDRFVLSPLPPSPLPSVHADTSRKSEGDFAAMDASVTSETQYSRLSATTRELAGPAERRKSRKSVVWADQVSIASSPLGISSQNMSTGLGTEKTMAVSKSTSNLDTMSSTGPAITTRDLEQVLAEAKVSMKGRGASW